MRSEPNDPYPGYVYIFYVAGFNPKEPRPTKIGFCHYRHNESPNETVVRRLKDIERHHWQSFVYRFSKALCCANVVEKVCKKNGIDWGTLAIILLIAVVVFFIWRPLLSIIKPVLARVGI